MRTIDWVPAEGQSPGHIRLVDQKLLPGTLSEVDVHSVEQLIDAIQDLSVRGAPALGVAGALGVALAAQNLSADSAREVIAKLRAARPTAVNLAWGVDAALAAFDEGGPEAALVAALKVRDDDIAACEAMAERGTELLSRLLPDRPRLNVMTICNTGALAAIEHGTALGVVEKLHHDGRLALAVACETRPLLQGARLTAWELKRMGADYRVIVDSAAASVLARGGADVVMVGADRIAANGDTANKIGTFALALAAAHAGVPFLVVAPESTIDPDTADGGAIEIEDRGSEEVCSFAGVRTTPEGTAALNPAFDVTPAGLITAIVTDTRVIDLGASQVPAHPTEAA
ncbi:initiation factor 2B subunit alpha [Wenjunlia vitaminophila]|uniref:Methylthioribose-1-phosphate isomerase n=1 Tax=Wenjunlia vitaminophila TaxID=76728 RepID=A0A0T6M001_WENVI|nr:S-methyl-5-thioribose-1-phosphate isomerase [Wenjunlia vitaminophila]KRV51295.1 initiation factor 2B subunit alpha [Wenjunlia vitaminophila]